MANIAKTYTLVNGQPADATQVNKNFDDIIAGVGDISAAGHALIDDADAAAQRVTLGGVVVGPASSTDNAIVRFDAATGKLVQNSSVIIDDAGKVGIGATAPSTSLDVLGIITTQSATPDAVANAAEGLRMAYGADTTLYRNSIFNEVSASVDSGLMQFRVNNGASSQATVISLFGNGNVGIGTVLPASKLSINGGLHVGGDSDAGNDNAVIDGTLTVGGQAAVVNNDARLSDARPASDVSAWAKAASNVAIPGYFGCNGKAARAAYPSAAPFNWGNGTVGFQTLDQLTAFVSRVSAIEAALVANGIMY